MRFKDLPECVQHTACNLLSGIYDRKDNKTAIAKEIRDAFIALYSEVENSGAYENLDSVVKEATCSILCKKYSPCGTHVGNVYLVIEDGISDAPEIGEFKNMFLYAPKGIEGISKEQPALKAGQDVGGNGYMEVISATNERLMINCDGIVAISESKGKGARIIFKSGMTEDVDMEYQAVVNAVLSAIKKR